MPPYFIRLQRMVHTNAFEQGDIFGGNTTRAFGLEGISRDSSAPLSRHLRTVPEGTVR